MKGIVLAGGSGTRLHPLTLAVSKQLMPIYDKPMIYYPISVLMSANINHILIITTPHDNKSFKKLLGDGSQFGCVFEYAIQEIPNGLAQAFVIGENFIGNDDVALILGDNIFYGSGLEKLLCTYTSPKGGVVFAYHVSDPERYGVVEFDKNNKAISIEVGILDRGTAWLDTGTHQSLMQASQYVQVIEERQGLKIGCLEEIAYRKGFINKQQLEYLAKPLIKSGYGIYLMHIVNE